MISPIYGCLLGPVKNSRDREWRGAFLERRIPLNKYVKLFIWKVYLLDLTFAWISHECK